MQLEIEVETSRLLVERRSEQLRGCRGQLQDLRAKSPVASRSTLMDTVDMSSGTEEATHPGENTRIAGDRLAASLSGHSVGVESAEHGCHGDDGVMDAVGEEQDREQNPDRRVDDTTTDIDAGGMEKTS